MKMIAPSNKCSSALLYAFVATAPLLACGGGQAQPETATSTNSFQVTQDPAQAAAMTAASNSTKAEASAAVKTVAPQTDLSALPTPISMPNKATCTFQTSKWANGTLKLKLEPGGAVYATINKPKSLKVLLPEGPLGDAYVEIDAGVAMVKGWLDGSFLSFYPKEALVLHGAATLSPNAKVAWQGGSVDNFRFSFDLDPKSASFTSGDASDTRPCASFGLEKSDFGSEKAFGTTPRSKVAFIPGNHSLSKDMNGSEKVVNLVTTERSPYAYLLASSGTRSQVAWSPTPSTYVFGWIDTKEIVKRGETVSKGEWKSNEPSLDAPARSTSVPSWKTVVCGGDIPLVGDVGGKKIIVGLVRGGKSIQLGPEYKGMISVSVPDSDIVVSDSGRLLVENSRVSSCKN